MASIFELFPIFEYANTACLDITRRVGIRRTIAADPKAYHPYTVEAGQRSDQIADGYYGMSEREWIVLYSADVLDPYFDWYQSDQGFSAHIISKYGSIEEATEKVHHWQLNWYATDQELSETGFESLDDTLKQYYEPVFGNGTRVLHYIRRKDDYTCTTNMYVTVTVANSAFTEGERVTISNSSTQVGQAEIAWCNSTSLVLHHVQSNTDVGLIVAGVDSEESQAITARSYTSNVIAIDERVFWEPVSMLAWEMDRNESNKDVRLLDSRYVNVLEEEFETLLKQDPPV